jgi:hypothetical protein
MKRFRIHYLIATPHAGLGGGAGFRDFRDPEAIAAWLIEESEAGRIVITTRVEVIV